MSRIAIDIVLLPDEGTIQRAIELNKELVKEHDGEIVLHRENCLPHISLAMGCVDERDVDPIRQRLQALAQESPVRQLQLVRIVISTNSRGESVSAFEVKKTGELQALHEAVMKELEPFFSYDVTDAMICDDVVAETALAWIRHYPEQAGFGRFQPHITLGYGEARTPMASPIPFLASRLAVCHLGNHCTCRKVLAVVRLQ